jgi:hypothetical protein
MAIQPDILATTLRILRDKEVDNTFRTTPILEATQRLGNVETVDGGSKVDSPVILTDHSTITQLSTGYEAVNLAVKDPFRTSSYEWCDFVAPVVMTKKEETSNKGERAIVRIYEGRMKQVMGMLRREVSKQLIAGNSSILTDLQTLNGFSAAAGTGWFEGEAFGSQSNTVGGIAKSGFPASWQNQAQTAGAAFATNGLRAMSRIFIDAQTYAPEGDIDLILASPTSYELYKNELQSLERYTSANEQRNMVGKLGLKYNGADMFIEPNLGYNGTVDKAGATVKPISMFFLNSSLFSVYFDQDGQFELEEATPISGYAATAFQIFVRMQICTSNLSGHGVLYDAEA